VVHLYNRIADRIESFIDSLTTPVLFIISLTIPVIIFWRPYFFFISDDWTALIQMVEHPFWQYLNARDAEQWFPFFHLVYYGMIQIAGPRYDILVLINGLLTGITAFLVFQFFQLHLHRSLALTLSLIYAGAAVHTATIWHPYNVCYILSFGFFVGALLLTNRYLRRPSWLTLGGIGLCCLLSLLSHSFAIMTISAVPLYGLLLRPGGGRRDFWPLAALTASLYLVFAAGYFTFAGLQGASYHNPELISSLPGLSYYLYVFCGGILSPNYHLVKMALFFPDLSESLFGPEFRFLGRLVSGLLFFLAGVGLIALRGHTREKRLCLWILLANLLPFILVGLARYKISIHQATSHRYGVFTLMGVLLLAGISWRILTRNMLPRHPWVSLLSLPLLALIIGSQTDSIAGWQREYQKKSALTRTCYENLPAGDSLDASEAKKLFCPEDHPWITKGQVLAIRRFLESR